MFTKCGMVWQDQADGVPRPNLKPDEIRRECDDSLRRLGVERIDLYQFHWPDNAHRHAGGGVAGASWPTSCRPARCGGRASPTSTSRCSSGASRSIHVDRSSRRSTRSQRDAAAELLPWCREHGTGVIAYSPMMSGLLTERFSAERVAGLDADDWRHGMPDVFGEPALSRNLALRDALRADRRAPRRHGRGEVAVAWVLAHGRA